MSTNTNVTAITRARRPAQAKLSDQELICVLEALSLFGEPKAAADALKTIFGKTVKVSLIQRIQCDFSKELAQNPKTAAQLIAQIPVANKVFRLRLLQELLNEAGDPNRILKTLKTGKDTINHIRGRDIPTMISILTLAEKMDQASHTDSIKERLQHQDDRKLAQTARAREEMEAYAGYAASNLDELDDEESAAESLVPG